MHYEGITGFLGVHSTNLLKSWVTDIPSTPGWDSETVPQPPPHIQQCLTGTGGHSAQQPKPSLAWPRPQEPSQSLTPPKPEPIFFLPSQGANLVATFEQWPIWSQKLVVSWKEKIFSASWIYCLPPTLLAPLHSSQQLSAPKAKQDVNYFQSIYLVSSQACFRQMESIKKHNSYKADKTLAIIYLSICNRIFP